MLPDENKPKTWAEVQKELQERRLDRMALFMACDAPEFIIQREAALLRAGALPKDGRELCVV